MATNQELKLASFKTISGVTVGMYNEIARKAFEAEATIAATDQYNEAFIKWLQYRTNTSLTSLNDLQAYFAQEIMGVTSWTDVGTIYKLDPVIWLDAQNTSTLTIDGSNFVSQWDSIVGSYSFTSSGADRPTYQATGMDGNPAVDFTGSDVMNCNSAASLFSGDDKTMAAFMVVEVDVLQNNDMLVWGSSTDADTLTILRQTATQYAFIKRPDSGGSAIGPIAGSTDTAVHVYSFTTDSTGKNATITVDGFDLATATIDVSQSTVDVLALGARDSFGSVSNNMNARTGEVLIFNREVGSEERQIIHNYLLNRWGI